MAPETQNGSTPNGDSTAKPTSISEHGDDGRPGMAGRLVGQGAGSAGPGGRARCSRRSTTYSTTRTTASTGAIRSAKPPKVRSRWGIASRFVRLETGSSREAELAIRRQACAPGRYGSPARDRGGDDDRGDQDDGGVEAEHGGDRRGEQEDAGEQRHRVAAR